MFVQTKLWRSFVGVAPGGKARCDAELRKSLKKLGVARLDLWLLHWPGPGRHLNTPPSGETFLDTLHGESSLLCFFYSRSGMSRPKVELPANKDKQVCAEFN